MRVARWTPVLALAATGLGTAPVVVAQQQAVVAPSVSVSQDGSSLELTDGRRIIIEWADGKVQINGETAGSYAPGSGLASSWRNR